ncbi:MAG TPA: hypothetical protein PKD17_05845 [Cellvibrionaceae bacterium]|nr:hypothetical protein [Cellvibrionaceae bacterium]HMW71320.1 hypothetical protein [Cellvibrionaceae bacterium]HMY40249.1 hypothetical protein [Marinagarivorans sp.]HNG59471.1 hypothetical protein [Cellvibrionaceae bacterium]
MEKHATAYSGYGGETSGKVWSLEEDKYCRFVVWVLEDNYKYMNLKDKNNWHGGCYSWLKVEDQFGTLTQGRDEILKIGEALCL